VFFPKGNVAKAYAIPDLLPDLPGAICERIVQICKQELMARFRQLPPLGNTYVDEALKNYKVPFALRSAGKSLRTLVRGSKINLPEAGDTIRFFTWWKEGEINGVPTGRVDIDLSAVLYDADWRYIEHISYTNLKSDKYQAAHSGDITSAPDGASEFIDIDIPSVLKFGGRYVVMSLNAYTDQPYCDLPECFAGWMIRQHPKSGEIYEPKTVQDKIDIAADTRICIPAILDLQDRQMIWCDLALASNPKFVNNIEGNEKGMVLMGQAMTNLQKPDLYALFSLHAEARGTRVADTATAQTIFSVQEGITPFDADIIMAEYL
jgi:stress response protein SCP2